MKFEKTEITYLGHEVTPSSESLDWGGFFSILTPKISAVAAVIVVVEAITGLDFDTLGVVGLDLGIGIIKGESSERSNTSNEESTKVWFNAIAGLIWMLPPSL